MMAAVINDGKLTGVTCVKSLHYLIYQARCVHMREEIHNE